MGFLQSVGSSTIRIQKCNRELSYIAPSLGQVLLCSIEVGVDTHHLTQKILDIIQPAEPRRSMIHTHFHHSFLQIDFTYSWYMIKPLQRNFYKLWIQTTFHTCSLVYYYIPYSIATIVIFTIFFKHFISKSFTFLSPSYPTVLIHMSI